jgi:DNA (cytosine-5)-methyltransferase 1
MDTAASRKQCNQLLHGQRITFGSLFAGIGGFDLGFERAGMECKWQVEIDDYATRVLEKHWPNVRRWRDVRTWPQPDTEHVDVICGGFPCQDISYAGLGAGLDGERSGLFFEAIRVVCELRPKVIVLENVAALLTRGLDRVLGTLAEVGFDAEWHCIPAGFFGTHFRRDRMFIVASSAVSRRLRREGFGSRPRGAWSEQQFARLVEHETRVCVPTGKMQRVSDGVPNRMDRLRGIGNAVVPQVAEWIGREIVRSM